MDVNFEYNDTFQARCRCNGNALGTTCGVNRRPRQPTRRNSSCKEWKYNLSQLAISSSGLPCVSCKHTLSQASNRRFEISQFPFPRLLASCHGPQEATCVPCVNAQLFRRKVRTSSTSLVVPREVLGVKACPGARQMGWHLGSMMLLTSVRRQNVVLVTKAHRGQSMHKGVSLT